jgi:hypothetical protein
MAVRKNNTDKTGKTAGAPRLRRVRPVTAGLTAVAGDTSTNGGSYQPHPPTIEEIRERAYELYLNRGSGHGDDVSDWLRAESELRAQPAMRS